MFLICFLPFILIKVLIRVWPYRTPSLQFKRCVFANNIQFTLCFFYLVINRTNCLPFSFFSGVNSRTTTANPICLTLIPDNLDRNIFYLAFSFIFQKPYFIWEWFDEDVSPACASQHSGRRTSRNTEDSWVRKRSDSFSSQFFWCKTLLQVFLLRVWSFVIWTNWDRRKKQGFAFVWSNMDLTYHHIMSLHLRLFLD